MTGQELMDKVKNEVGFTLFPLTFPAYGQRVYAGKTAVCDLDGNILRIATEADIKKWNTVWNRTVKEATQSLKKK
jgi:hypothetical protein